MDCKENDVPNNSSIPACAFVAAVIILPSHCLATIRGYKYTHTDRWEGYMEYIVQMGSDAIIYMSSFIKIGSGIQTLMGRGIHRQQGYLISLLLFFQNKESR
jgi:hypothetical protein